MFCSCIASSSDRRLRQTAEHNPKMIGETSAINVWACESGTDDAKKTHVTRDIDHRIRGNHKITANLPFEDNNL